MWALDGAGNSKWDKREVNVCDWCCALTCFWQCWLPVSLRLILTAAYCLINTNPLCVLNTQTHPLSSFLSFPSSVFLSLSLSLSLSLPSSLSYRTWSRLTLMLSWSWANLSLRIGNLISHRKTQQFESTVSFPCCWKVAWLRPLTRATPSIVRWPAPSSSVPNYTQKSTATTHSKQHTQTTSFNIGSSPVLINTQV